MMHDTVREDMLVDQFKAIAHPLRLRILETLAAGEHNVGEIEQSTAIGQPTLSQQLGVLRKAGLVETRKEAKLVFYRLAPQPIAALCATLHALAPATTSPLMTIVPSPSPAPGVANFARLS